MYICVYMRSRTCMHVCAYVYGIVPRRRWCGRSVGRSVERCTYIVTTIDLFYSSLARRARRAVAAARDRYSMRHLAVFRKWREMRGKEGERKRERSASIDSGELYIRERSCTSSLRSRGLHFPPTPGRPTRTVLWLLTHESGGFRKGSPWHVHIANEVKWAYRYAVSVVNCRP